jgi:hypothetical protein
MSHLWIKRVDVKTFPEVSWKYLPFCDHRHSADFGSPCICNRCKPLSQHSKDNVDHNKSTFPALLLHFHIDSRVASADHWDSRKNSLVLSSHWAAVEAVVFAASAAA